MKQFFSDNRRKLFAYMRNGSAAIFFAGRAPYKRGDEVYPFAPDRNFYYLTGFEEERAILLLKKDVQGCSETLYIQRESNKTAKWTGATATRKEAAQIASIDAVEYLDKFYTDISETVFRDNISKIYLDLENRDWEGVLSPSLLFSAEIRNKFPNIKIKNIYAVMGEFRKIKEKYELDLIKKAIHITRLGIEEMMRHAHSGQKEFEIEAYFDYILTKHGVRDKAFRTIAASGPNATVLHYVKNNRETQDGDLILFDLGAQWQWYNGDITRTFPVNGKFTQKQKQIYNIVLEGQKKVIEAIRPGVLFDRLNEILREHYFTALKQIGLVNKPEEVSKYYFHGVSHFLGAETHDVGRAKGMQLMAGMVLTVEPGLYIEESNMGIRIEDDVLVTENGCEVLSCDIIKSVEEIEAFMAGREG